MSFCDFEFRYGRCDVFINVEWMIIGAVMLGVVVTIGFDAGGGGGHGDVDAVTAYWTSNGASFGRIVISPYFHASRVHVVSTTGFAVCDDFACFEILLADGAVATITIL